MRSHAIAVLSAFLCVAAAGSALAAAPTAPTTVRKDRIDATHVRITWSDNSSDEDGFEILRRTIVDPDFESRGTVGQDVTEFVDEAPKDTVFIYQVRAFRDDLDSDLSNQCYVNRPAPAVPNYFNARLIALYLVRNSWIDLAQGERGFEVQRAPFGTTKWKTIAVVPANTTTYDDHTLMPATTYSYRARTLGRPGICWGDSGFTPVRTVTTKGAVRILTVELRGRGKGKVTSSPAGISCSPTDNHCTAEFPFATDVFLTEKPASNSHFAGWADYGPCEGSKNNVCKVYLGDDHEVGVPFKLNR